MLDKLLELSLKNRLVVIILFLCTIAGGVYFSQKLRIDAFPDPTPVMIQVNTVASSLNPEEIELQISTPLEQAISGLPGLDGVRSVSKFGFSQIETRHRYEST